MGLHDVREQMAVIPQDSFIISGSLRFNVDPFGRFSDDEVLHVLDQIRFAETLLCDKPQSRKNSIVSAARAASFARL